MKRVVQSLTDIVRQLSDITSDWKDEHFLKVESLYEIVDSNSDHKNNIKRILEQDFKAGKTLLRSFLSLSKDQFDLKLKNALGASGVTVYKKDKGKFLSYLIELGLEEEISNLTSKQYTWKDLISEKLKSGRGSAIVGQKRGRGFEDDVEHVVEKVFGKNNFDTRCQFVGLKPESTEKTDFAIPNKTKPQILIEAKAYGATGSKQTDIIGDVTRIVNEKRPDTFFLLTTDGLTWQSRKSDLQKLVKLQNEGKIYRIYTSKMFIDLGKDLLQLKEELSIK